MKLLVTSILFSALIFTGCKTEPEEGIQEDGVDPSHEVGSEDAATLAEKLEAKKSRFMENAAQEKIDAYEEGLALLREQGVGENALGVGDKAVPFQLKNTEGETVRLSEMMRRGPVVVTWYRGGWCPYCNLTLREYQTYMPAIRERGASLLALSPEIMDSVAATQNKHDLEFDVLSDVGNAVAKKYGLAYTVPDHVMSHYDKAFSLDAYSGNSEDELPLTATYVIDQDGTIQWAFVDVDYRKRAEPSDIIEALDALQEVEVAP
ncbi:MAG: peroxiredoxin [Ectothiorhodospiraceae bacterium]|nr:peroxiredoxin [Ectothiorhodospiraceae bacterium]